MPDTPSDAVRSRLPKGRVRIPAELQHDGSASVDHQVEPPVVPRHGKALVGQVGGDAGADQPHALHGHHLASNHCRPAEDQKHQC